MAHIPTPSFAQPITTSDATQDTAKLLLRVVLGFVILLHGISKIKGGPGFVLDVVDKAGLPHPFGYLVYVGEVLAPVLMIVGFWTRAGRSSSPST
jgi:putative oxidoreductase